MSTHGVASVFDISPRIPRSAYLIPASLEGSATNRWNRAGDPTFFIASVERVALAEFARHFRERQDPALGALAVVRAVFELHVRLNAVVDLRQGFVRSVAGLRGGMRRFLDAEVARATATFIRRTTSAEAVLVPSVAFLDDATCWNLVLFLEKLPEDLTEFVTATASGNFRVAPQATG